MKNKIAKSLVACSLITSSLLADAYIGVSYAKAGNTDTREWSSGNTYETTNDYSELKVKFGSGTDGGMKLELGLSQIKYDAPILAPVTTAADGDTLLEVTLNLKKEFEVTKSVYPFINAGFGAGTLSESALTDGSLTEISFNVGAGLSFKATDNLYIEGGVEYVGRRWQDVESNSSSYTISPSAAATKSYAGVNFKF